MGQTFAPDFDQRWRLGCLALGSLLFSLVLVLYGLAGSSWVNGHDLGPSQPVDFSHRHHAGELGIDCRYCHGAVETSDQAGLPSTGVCMTCHSQLFTDAKMLEPVRRSWMHNQPMAWKRVNELPDFVKFSHQVHVQNGVSCTECHGRVDRSAQLSPAHNFSMGWCLECHRDPAYRLRPRDQVVSPDWNAPSHVERDEMAQYLMKEYRVELPRLTECATCHR